MASGTGAAPIRRRRPRDRKQQLLGVAAELFAAEGFDDVSVGRIAAAVDITPGALYRHHAGKEELLAAVLLDQGERMLAGAEAATTLDELVQGQAREVARMPTVGVLWAREMRHLGPERGAAVVALTREANRRYAALLAVARPDLDAGRLELVAWAMQSVMVSLGGRVRGLREERLVAMLAGAAHALAAVELPAQAVGDGVLAEEAAGLQPVSRRESLLMAAGRLFGERGYRNTSLAEVGRAAGMTGPGVLSHFASKEALVDAALERGVHAAWLDLHAAFAASRTPGEVLDRLLASYVGFAYRQPHLVASLVSDPGGASEDWRRRQREYVAEWDALLAAQRPDLDAESAQVLVRATLTVVGNLARMRRQRRRPGFVPDVLAMGRAVLGSAPAQLDDE